MLGGNYQGWWFAKAELARLWCVWWVPGRWGDGWEQGRSQGVGRGYRGGLEELQQIWAGVVMGRGRVLSPELCTWVTEEPCCTALIQLLKREEPHHQVVLPSHCTDDKGVAQTCPDLSMFCEGRASLNMALPRVIHGFPGGSDVVLL